MPRRLYQQVQNNYQEYSLLNSRLAMLVTVIVCCSCLLVARLAWLQLFEYKRYETMSLKNQMSVTPISPPRGIILDRNNRVLAENRSVHVLEIIPEHVSNMEQTLKNLQKLIPSISSEDIENFKKSRNQNRAFIPIPLKLKLTQEELALFATHQHQFNGVNIKAHLMRFYPFGEITAHLLGYVGRINIQELQRVDPVNYRATNFIGKSGIEKYYEDLLHGQVGYQQVETDVSGRTLRILDKQNPVSGEKLYLTIDVRLQQTAFNALSGKRGAVVLMDVEKGEVLALVSAPAFDPNVFVHGIPFKQYQELAGSKERPLYNRAVRGLYPPASTIKPYVALAGLDKSAVDSHFRIYDPGWFKLPNSSHSFRDWKRGGHGTINVSRAIMVSCDTYFYQLGQRLGISAIHDTLQKFGFGELTHIDLYEEARGILPNPEWKKRSKGVPWYPGDTLISAIGQGFMLASPLQLASAASTLSSRGRHVQPHLRLKSEQTDRHESHVYQPVVDFPVKLNPEHWNIVIEAMHSVITSNEGTGYRFGRDAAYSVAAKTGTAQVFGGKKYEKRRQEDMPEYLRDHSLFIAFAPVEKPEVAIAVMVENDTLASHVARVVLDTWFQLKQQAHSGKNQHEIPGKPTSGL